MLDSEIPAAESLTIEFKSDQKRLPDKDLVLAAVCLANTDGGLIYLGVEDDGQPNGALGLTRTGSGQRIPTVVGLLLIGRESAIRAHLPTHESAFQVLDGTEVRVNDFYRWPLVRLFERVEEQFLARVSERELQVGLFRVPVPNVEPRAFREAFVNALTHRDYSRLGSVQARWQTETLSISSPGGFVEGVSLDNLLVVEPRPRNPLLADAFKRIGLAERTGRGVDLIYQGLLRYGRPPPSYLRSDAAGVVVDLSCSEADLNFLKFVLEQEQGIGALMPLDDLLILSRLKTARRLDSAEVAGLTQRDPSAARAAIERLVERGLVQAHGIKKGRTYTLSPAVYRTLGQAADYIRQVGFDPLQQEQMVLSYVDQHGKIRRQDVRDLCQLSPDQATRLLQRLVKAGRLLRTGTQKGAFYKRAGTI